MSVDLPTFGRPMTHTRIESPGATDSPSSPATSTSASTASISSSRPRECAAAMARGSPSPSAWNSATATSSSRPSDLLTATVAGLPLLRMTPATKRSVGVSPSRPSTTSTTWSASSIALRVCAAIGCSMPRGDSIRPPVSTTMKRRPAARPKPYLRSRVTPGTSATSASRVAVSTLKTVDLPTLGRPTMAMTGSMAQAEPCGSA